MDQPNQPLSIFNGKFELRNDNVKLSVQGEIYFTWTPTIGVKFTGTVVEGNLGLRELFEIQKISLAINGSLIGTCYINKTHASSDGSLPTVAGSVSGRAILGDKTIPVRKVSFAVPNLMSFHGENVHDGDWVGHHRLVFENEEYIITLDKRRDFKEANDKLEESGGYMILYYGEIQGRSGTILYEELGPLLRAFQTFLTFINGRRTSIFFLEGRSDKVIWTDYTGYFVDPFKFVTTWPPRRIVAGIIEMWKPFSRYWKNENDQDFLNTCIHWYVEANNNSGFAEGSIVMAQIALEFIYNWYLIEGKRLLMGNDAERLSASNKIRLVLSELGISTDFPKSCRTLRETGFEDAPEAFVQIRNGIIHSQEEKRRKHNEIPGGAKADALHLGIWYIELALLKILEYKGEYENRTSGNTHREDVALPWVPPSA